MSDHSMPALPEPDIYPLLCEASGETDLPAAFIAHNDDELRHFITVEWTPGESETEGLIDALKNHDWRELGNYSFEFEIGGMSFSRVYETARAAPLLERIKELEADAARYRVIRDWGATFMDDQEKSHHVCEHAMDAVVDAALSTKDKP